MAKTAKPKTRAKPRFRSQLWFDNPDDPGATDVETPSAMMLGKSVGVDETG